MREELKPKKSANEACTDIIAVLLGLQHTSEHEPIEEYLRKRDILINEELQAEHDSLENLMLKTHEQHVRVIKLWQKEFDEPNAIPDLTKMFDWICERLSTRKVETHPVSKMDAEELINKISDNVSNEALPHVTEIVGYVLEELEDK